jgi:hypothetical protein
VNRGAEDGGDTAPGDADVLSRLFRGLAVAMVVMLHLSRRPAHPGLDEFLHLLGAVLSFLAVLPLLMLKLDLRLEDHFPYRPRRQPGGGDSLESPFPKLFSLDLVQMGAGVVYFGTILAGAFFSVSSSKGNKPSWYGGGVAVGVSAKVFAK